MAKSNEERFEFSDQALHKLNEIIDSPDDWLGFDNVRLADGYIKGKLHVLLRIALAGKEWLALFESGAEIGRSKSGNSKVFVPPAAVNADTDISNIDDSGKQGVMLIGNVQFMEYPEIMTLPVFVRFGVPDFILGILPHSMYLSSKRGFVNLGALENRESGLIGDGNGMATNIDKLAGQVVKGTPDIMNGVSSKKADRMRDGVDTAWHEDIKTLISRLGIWIGVEGVKIALQEPVPSDYQITDVLLGPFNFYLDNR